MTSYRIQRGDTLSSIARRHNVGVDTLARANEIADPNRIQAGRTLVIPDGWDEGARPVGGGMPAGGGDSFEPDTSALVPQIDLQRGMQGAEVEALQSSLVRLGHMSQATMDTGPGIFGPGTQAALQSFQSANGVPATGYYGPLSRAALQQSLGGASPTQPTSPTSPTAPTTPTPLPSSIPGAEQAISYATNPPPNPMSGDGSWHYWCLGLVNQAYQSSGQVLPNLQVPKAYDAYLAYDAQGKVHYDGSPPPRGALVFFDSYMPYGHIGISTGDGQYIGTYESGPNSGLRSIHDPTYLGWAYP
jgi:LysM repeat protein